MRNRSTGSKIFARGVTRVPSEHALRMARLYRGQAGIFDVTRVPILLGRARLRPLLAPGAAVLEVGCGTGHNLRALRSAVGPDGRVIGIECAPAMAMRALRRTGDGIEVYQAEYGAGTDLPGVAGLDAVVFSYSLSMIPQFERVLRQARRDLKPGGRLILLDFANPKWRWMRRLMRRSGVELGNRRATAVCESFDRVNLEYFRAWGGLWDYYLLVAETPPRPSPASSLRRIRSRTRRLLDRSSRS